MRREMRDATDAELNRALDESNGNLAEAKEILERRGVHGGLGVLSYQKQLNIRKAKADATANEEISEDANI
jgi:hypothetical protein